MQASHAQPLRVLSRRYHFSVAGVAYVITTLVLVLGAVNGQNNLLFALFGLAVAGLLISGVLSGSALMGVRMRRETSERASVGEPWRVRYHVTNRNWIVPCFGLTIEEVARGRTLLGARHESRGLDRLGRVIGSAPYVPPRGTVIVDVVLEPLRRGEVVLNPVRVSSTFPFGIARKSVLLGGDARVIIRPRGADLPAEQAQAHGVTDSVQGVLAPSRTGQEFFALRDYQPGDSPRSVAWRATARLDRPVVRSLAHPPGSRVWIALSDCDAQHADAVASVAAALATRAIASGLAVGLLTPRGELEAMRGGRRQIALVLDALALWAPGTSSEPPPAAIQDCRVIVVHAGAGTPWLPGTQHASVNAIDPRIKHKDIDAKWLPNRPSEESWRRRLRRWLGEEAAA